MVTPHARALGAPRLACLAGLTCIAWLSPAAAEDLVLDPEEIRPHIVSTVNDGALSPEGPWAQTPADVRSIFLDRAVAAAEGGGAPRIHLYSHGGMTGEASALRQVPILRDTFAGTGVYPVAFIWRSGVWTTASNILREAIGLIRGGAAARPPGVEELDDWIEVLARWLGGKALWDEMKENVERSATRPDGGVRLAVEALAELAATHPGTEIHLTGYSAGAILMGHVVQQLHQVHGVPVASCTLLVPAITVDAFMETYAPALHEGYLGRVKVFALDDAHERDDTVYWYGKSVLYLVRNAFEAERFTPLVGMEIAPEEAPALARLVDAGRVEWVTVPNDLPLGHPHASRATHHGGFSSDDTTYRALREIVVGATSGRGGAPPVTRHARSTAGRGHGPAPAPRGRPPASPGPHARAAASGSPWSPRGRFP